MLFIQVVLCYCVIVPYYNALLCGTVPVSYRYQYVILTVKHNKITHQKRQEEDDKKDDKEAATATPSTVEGKDCVGINDMKLM